MTRADRAAIRAGYADRTSAPIRGEGDPHYALDERARVIRDRIRPELAEVSALHRGMISHYVEGPTLLPVLVRRWRLRADGVVESISEHPERAEIARMRRALA
jgi:hypothetical protein